MPDFSLCLTHDVDRPYKTFQAVYEVAADRNPGALLDLLPGNNPYWQFEEVMALESELGVRSSFYFLQERPLRSLPPREWLRPSNWPLYLGRYDLKDPRIVEAIRALDDGGWEVGLHGSYTAYRDPDRLAVEKQRLESVLDGPVVGGRQHYLNLDVPETWKHHADVGLRYDASLGSSTTYGFDHGFGPRRPFDDEFVVFPLTLMEVALPDPGDNYDEAWAICRDLLETAREESAVMSVLWHPRFFNEDEFPGYRSLYVQLVERAQEMDAWVGPPAELYERLDHPTPGYR